MSVSRPHEAEAHAHPELGFVRKYIFSTDHKIIGIQFLFSTLIFLVIGGTAGLAGAHAARPGRTPSMPILGTLVARTAAATACRRSSTTCSSACTPRS